MTFPHRIRTIYYKELIDILRDRRTLIAMIVVPIVLYPLLMLGSIQAVSYQAGALAKEKIVVGVLNERQGQLLWQIIEQDAAILEQERERHEGEGGDASEVAQPLKEYVDVRAFGSRKDLRARVQDRTIEVGLVFEEARFPTAPDEQLKVEILADQESVRSAAAHRRLADLFDRVQERIRTGRKRLAGLPEAFDKPVVLESSDLSSPPSILGQILPLILILMTITGAIYPAIDLTAGERERGTLESLMVSPVPVPDLIIGKFLVVTTIAIMGAALNLASVTATVYFGGFDQVIATTDAAVPIGSMIFILLCLVPFAVLMSAIMIAVCSYARTFKEAQNYVTPVILAVLVPGGIAALPATRLDGIMLVMPVGNMVLLARDFLMGAVVGAGQVAMVLLSTTFYAAAAVAVAASIFGQESVVFADSGSLRSSFLRRPGQPADRPTLAAAVLIAALLFPTWFFVQASLSPRPGEDQTPLLYTTAWLMPAVFVAVPLALCVYAKISPVGTFGLRWPPARHFAAAVLIGASVWVPAREVTVLQFEVFGRPEFVQRSVETLQEALRSMPLAAMLLVIAVVPAVCEELFFRGFLLSGLGSSAHKWTAILVSACIFGVFHFFLFRFIVTAGLGIVLAYLCWQSRSIVPPIVAHALHNGLSVTLGLRQTADEAAWSHLPLWAVLAGSVVFIGGLALAWGATRPARTAAAAALAEA